MLGVEHDHLVEALAPNGADETFHDWILPGRTGGNEIFLRAQGHGSRLELEAVNAVAIAQQIARWIGVRERFGQLLGGSSRRGHLVPPEMQNLAARMDQH